MSKQILKMIAPSEITIEDNYNVRLDFRKSDDFKELKASIKKHGVKTPLTAREGENGKFILIAGHRRLLAVSHLIKEGLTFKTIPVLAQTMTEKERTIDLLLSNNGKPLNLLEQGAIFHRMENVQGYKRKEVAAEVSKTQAHIGNAVKMFESTPEIIREAIAAEKIACSLVLEMITQFKSNGKKIVKAFESAVERAAKEDPARKKLTRKDIRFPRGKSAGGNGEGGDESKEMLGAMYPENKKLFATALNDLIRDFCADDTETGNKSLEWEINRFSRETLARIPVTGEQSTGDTEPTNEQLEASDAEDATQAALSAAQAEFEEIEETV